LRNKVVSNPWREAIEGRRFNAAFVRVIVSNPWREAIEDKSAPQTLFTTSVSNPWREAIEEANFLSKQQKIFSFPILGGRLLK